MEMGCILDSDHMSFGKLIEEPENQYTQGMKSFPQRLSKVFTMTNNWTNSPSNLHRHNPSEGVAFVTKG